MPPFVPFSYHPDRKVPYINVRTDEYGPLNSYQARRSNNTNPGEPHNPYTKIGTLLKDPGYHAPATTRSKRIGNHISLYLGSKKCPITREVPKVGLRLSDGEVYDGDAIARWYMSDQGKIKTPLRKRYTPEDIQKIEGFINTMILKEASFGGKTRTKKATNRKSRKNRYAKK